MKALVTGAAGFIGRRMVRWLEEIGYNVFGVDIVPTMDRRVSKMDVINFFLDDLEDVKIGRGNVERYDLVVHCAYVVGGRETIDNDYTALAKNLQLDALMFRWAHETEQGHVLYFSSSAVYPVELQTGKLPMSKYDGVFHLAEQHACIDLPLLPDGNYGWAKLTGEKLAMAHRMLGHDVTVVRPFSGYGWDQSLDYPFPMFIDRAIRGDEVFEIWGSALQQRDWIHVDDVVAGALAAVREGISLTNLGTGVGISMGQLANMIVEAAGNHDPAYKTLYDKPMGVMQRVADPEYMHSFFEPKHSLQDGINEAVALRRLHFHSKD